MTAQPILVQGLTGIIAYLIGAIPFGLILGLLKGRDIRTMGSGNIGATNVFRCIGKGPGILAFSLDVAKGFAAAYLLPRAASMIMESAPSTGLAISCTVLAVVGHNWPVYLRFKGGKGIATTAGGLLGLAPAAMGIGLAAWVIVFVTGRYVSLASMVAALAAAAAGWWRYGPEEQGLAITLTILAVMAVWRHRSNIQRLAAGTENRFQFGKKQ